MTDDDIFKGLGIKIALKEDFAKVREVLTRIGIANYKTKTLIQSVHIFHKRGEYALMHFKEMFKFDGKPTEFTDEDEARVNRVAKMLEEWGLIEILDDLSEADLAPINSINIISRKMKNDENWTLHKKYTLGKR